MENQNFCLSLCLCLSLLSFLSLSYHQHIILFSGADIIIQSQILARDGYHTNYLIL